MGNRPSTTVLKSGTSESNRPVSGKRGSCSQSRRARAPTGTDADWSLHLCPIVSSPCGSRTQPARLERPMTSPEVERAVCKRVSFSASSILTRRWPSLHCLLDSTRSAHGRVRPFIAFTPVVDVSIAQQQAVVQRVFWDWFEHPVGYSHLTRPAFCSGKQSPDPLSGSSNAFRRPL